MTGIATAVLLIVIAALCALIVYRCICRKKTTNADPRRECEDDEICLHPPSDYHHRVRDTNTTVRLAIVTQTKNPIGLSTWLRHHRNMGIERIFLSVEDTPSVKALVESLEFASFVTASFSTGVTSYFTNMDRQSEFVNASIQAARNDGYTHLVHIDDDELLFFPLGKRAFYDKIQSMEASSIRMNNIEAVYDSSNCSDPFKTARYFCLKPIHFTAYANGKSIGNLADSDLQAHGPHMFTGKRQDLPSYFAVVVHYESACLRRWAEKFRGYALDTPNACNEKRIPFPYYCESIQAFKNDPKLDHAELWERWKTKKYRSTDGIVELNVLGI